MTTILSRRMKGDTPASSESRRGDSQASRRSEYTRYNQKHFGPDMVCWVCCTSRFLFNRPTRRQKTRQDPNGKKFTNERNTKGKQECGIATGLVSLVSVACYEVTIHSAVITGTSCRARGVAPHR